MPLSAFQRPKAHALAFFYQLSMQYYFHSPLKASDHADSSNIDGQDQKRKKKFKKDKALQDTKKMRYPDLWFCIFLSLILFFWFTSLYYKFTFTMFFVNPKTSQLNKRQIWMQRLKREIVYNSKLSNATIRQVSYPVRFNFCCSPLVLTGKRMVKIILLSAALTVKEWQVSALLSAYLPRLVTHQQNIYIFRMIVLASFYLSLIDSFNRAAIYRAHIV